ncbi:hypothetical protein GCM10007421_23820 [Halopseudomonas oceani]|nr:hypothetical protein GCM10007421_23820 [Halopseudomonas oceani]
MKLDSLPIARKALAEIEARFPWLKLLEDRDAPVELSVTIPVQPGIKQEIWLCLQNYDELHFSVGHFCLGWFPCTDPERVSEYVDAVCGFIGGESRVIEQYRGDRCVKARLQAPDQGKWKTIGTWTRLSLPFPWRVTWNEVRNA